MPDSLKNKPKLRYWQKLEYEALLAEQAKRNARRDMLFFARYMKENYRDGWHHRYLAEKLNAFARGEIKRLIVSMPPRHGKSELVSRMLPAFIFGLNPHAQVIACSYGAELASRMNRDVQRLMDSSAYADIFPNTKLGSSNVRATAEGSVLKNSDIFEIVGHRGVYRCAGTGGAITGMGGNFIIIDDPVKDGQEAMSPGQRDRLWEWYQATLYSRLETDAGSDGGILVTMTRWHEDDLVGRLLKQAKADSESDQWEVVEFPAIRETGENLDDPREMSEPLWPDKYPLEKLSRLRNAIGSKWWNALYQQRPSAQEGGIIKRTQIKYYRQKDLKNVFFDTQIQSWDATFKDTQKSDFVVGQVWGRCQTDKYLLHQVRDRMDIIRTMDEIKKMSARFPNAMVKLIEDKANGPAIITMLKSKLTGLIPVEPEGSKEARLSAVAPEFEGGYVWLPHPDEAPWILNLVEELVNFPNAAHDDQCDALSQGLWRLRQNMSDAFSEDFIPDRIKSISGSLLRSF